MGTVNKNVRFDVVNRRTDFFRWQQRQTNKILHDALHVPATAVGVLEADFVGSLDNSLSIVARLRLRLGTRVEIPPLKPPRNPPSHMSVRIVVPAVVLFGTPLRARIL